MELDILCIRGGLLTLGDAKKRTNWEKLGGKSKEIEKYRDLEAIGAEALVFATFADSWSDSTLRNIRSAVPSQIAVTLLTGPELLTERQI